MVSSSLSNQRVLQLIFILALMNACLSMWYSLPVMKYSSLFLRFSIVWLTGPQLPALIMDKEGNCGVVLHCDFGHIGIVIAGYNFFFFEMNIIVFEWPVFLPCKRHHCAHLTLLAYF